MKHLITIEIVAEINDDGTVDVGAPTCDEMKLPLSTRCKIARAVDDCADDIYAAFAPEQAERETSAEQRREEAVDGPLTHKEMQ